MLFKNPFNKPGTGIVSALYQASTFIVFGVIAILLTSQNVTAQTDVQAELSARPDISICTRDSAERAKHLHPRAFAVEDIDKTEISADRTESASDGSTTLDGNVIIERHLLRISTDHAHYDKTEDSLTISGNIRLDTTSLSLDADSGLINNIAKGEQASMQGSFTNINFLIPESNLKGKAEKITARDAGKTNRYSTLENASITSCDLIDPDWLISAGEIQLDHDDEYGSASDVVIRFKGVPFLYAPYIEFPTSDKRRSGFLFPELSTSSSRGIELATPWYWNIAPNHDALFTPRYMEKRGLALGSSYRYLTHSSKGKLEGSYLDRDKITQDERYQYQYNQHSIITSNLMFDMEFSDISDPEYFNDFSSSLAITSQTHLNRSARLNYNLNDWRMRALIQDIKTIDTTIPVTDRPYVRVPQLTLDGQTRIVGDSLFFTLNSEFVDFTHEDNNKTTGTRFTIQPGLHLPLSGTAWFLDSAVKFNHTQYHVGTEAGTTEEIDNRSLPISSVDAGLFFERNLDTGYQQTLEPRVYFLYVPFEDQDNIPLFDTSIPEFSVAQLFRNNRFVGGDRIGDANQLTFSLTSRILNSTTGSELLRASIGQIFYFEDRRVSLDGSVDSSSQSDIIAELDATWRNWKSNIDIQWGTTSHELSKENYFLHYKSDNSHLFNIGYRKRQKNSNVDIEQTDTSFVYAINRTYRTFVRWNYSLKDSKDIDIIGGLEYDSCCWSIQLLAQRRVRNTTEDVDAYENSILVQFVFKGLGSLTGGKVATTLEQSIYGYTDTPR